MTPLRTRLGLPLPDQVGKTLAYIAAFTLAPFVVAALGFWVSMIPILAIWFGAMPYLLLAGPGFALALRRWPPNPLTFALIAVTLNIGSPPIFALMLIALGHPPNWDALAPLWRFGFYLAPFWGAAFAILYRAVHRLLTAPA
ncbi:hypothetical protein [Thiosulfatihalobacter marinus]|uniref:hypothetical protein n=1 Tax=Thiosulfatihalobacter marinus TaxID=2792481 RepID=UPI0018D5C208|nr:hypothetical protein [Thiosulfatihalobacter marinus]